MYVWEVREVVAHEGNLWSVLVIEDENSLRKIKQIVISRLEIYLETQSNYLDYLIKSNAYQPSINKGEGIIYIINRAIERIGYISDIEDFHDFQVKYNTLEVEKIEVL